MILEFLSYLIMIPSAVLCLLPMHSQLKYSIRQILLPIMSSPKFKFYAGLTNYIPLETEPDGYGHHRIWY